MNLCFAFPPSQTHALLLAYFLLSLSYLAPQPTVASFKSPAQGETKAAIETKPLQAVGVTQPGTMAFAVGKMGMPSQHTSVYSNLRIPFRTELRITLQLAAGVQARKRHEVWCNCFRVFNFSRAECPRHNCDHPEEGAEPRKQGDN